MPLLSYMPLLTFILRFCRMFSQNVITTAVNIDLLHQNFML